MEEYTEAQLEYISGMKAMYSIVNSKIVKAKMNQEKNVAKALENALSVLLLDRLAVSNSFVGVHSRVGEKLNISVPENKVDAYVEGCSRAELILIENINPAGELTFEEELSLSDFITKSVDRLKELRDGK